MADRQIKPGNTYQDRLFALIPGEITAAYIAIHGTIEPNTDKYNWLLALAALFLIALNIPYLKKFQNVVSAKQIAFTCGAFVFWAASIENERLYQAGFDPKVITVLLILYTLCAPFFVV